jgi:hypothetical protein
MNLSNNNSSQLVDKLISKEIIQVKIILTIRMNLLDSYSNKTITHFHKEKAAIHQSLILEKCKTNSSLLMKILLTD